MKLYIYDKETLRYKSSRDALLDVLETEKRGEEVYSKPMNATFVAPPEVGAGKVAVYNKELDSWTVTSSNIGCFVVNTKLGVLSKIEEDRPIRSYEIIISEEQYLDMKSNPMKYVVRDNELLDISGTQEYQDKVNIEKYENLIRVAKERYDKFLETPVRYKGSYYLPRYLDDYEKLQLRSFPQEIWDAEGLTSKVMSKNDFMSLKAFLEDLVNKAYKEKKESIKKYKLAIKKLEG